MEGNINLDSTILEAENDETYNLLIKYDQLLKTRKYQSEELNGKQLLMAVGATGTGKSTLMNAII